MRRAGIRFMGGLLGTALCLCGGVAEDTARVASLNSQIARGGGNARALLAQRRDLIFNLIRTAPELVRGLALKNSSVSDLVEQAGEWNGSLEVLAEMDFAKGTAVMHRYLRTSGARVELFAEARQFGHMDSMGGATLRLKGIGLGGRVAVDSIEPLAAALAPPIPTGVQNYAVLVVTGPTTKTFPSSWTMAAIQNLFFGTSGSTLNAFWQEASYGKTSATGTVFGPFALPAQYTCKAQDTSDSEALRQAAITAAQGAVDFTQFNRIAIVFPNNSCSYGGLASVGPGTYPDLPNVSSTAWFPVFAQNTPTNYVQIAAHEAGHNLGLSHANSEDYGTVPLGPPGSDGINTEYGDPYSVMGVGEGGSSGTIIGQYSAPHKAAILGWLDSTGFSQVTSPGSYSVAPLEGTSGIRGLRVLRDPVTHSWLWIESRQPLGMIDSTLAGFNGSNVFRGALIHFENPDLDPLHTYLLDFHPAASPNNFATSAMQAGETWEDPYSLLHLNVNSAGASGVSVDVGYDAPCASVASSGAIVPPEGGSGTIQVTAPQSCSWTVTTGDPWISVSPASGSGNGTVKFTVDSNTSSKVRNGAIIVQRQSLVVTQEVPGISGLSVSPGFGSGQSGTFTFLFSDTNGVAEIDFANLVFGTNAYSNPICYASANTAGYIWLLNDAGTTFTGPVFLNKPGSSISNSTCTIYGDSTITAQGNMLTVGLHVQFAPSVTGSFDIFAFGHTKSGFTGPWTLGQWMAGTPAGPVLSSAVSAASFAKGGIAPESINALFGTNLSSGTVSANTIPLPTVLNGVSVFVVDSAGVSRAAPLYFVSATQINFEVPPGTAAGPATLMLMSNGVATGTLGVAIKASAPGLFVVNSAGLPAAESLTVPAKGNATAANVFQVDSSGAIVPSAVDLGQGQVFLILFGTGIKGAKQVTATVGGLTVPVPFAGAQGGFVGEDQLNVGPLPMSLAGKGAVPVIVTADGLAANIVTVTIK